MTKNINTLHDAVLYMLRGLWYTETVLKDELNRYEKELTSPEVRSALRQYIENTNESLQRLERIFNHFMVEPVARKNEVVTAMVHETRDLLHCPDKGHIKDILLIGCTQNINTYKKANYKATCLFILEMEMDATADIVQKIWQSEQQTCQTLATLSIHEFNKANS